MGMSFLKRAGLGFLMGMAVSNMFTFFFSWLAGGKELVFSTALLARTGGELGAMVLQTFGGGVYGAITMGTTVVYDIERWSLAKSSFTHCLIVIGLYVPAGLLLGWGETVKDFLCTMVIQFILYCIIWLVMHFTYRAEIRKINELQNSSMISIDLYQNKKGGKGA